MVEFILLAIGLFLVALGFVLPRLWSQRRWALATGSSIALLISGLYAGLGNPLAIQPALAVQTAPPGSEQIAAMVQRLAQRLEKAPDDPDGWRMLARSYETQGQFDQAVQAYRKLLALEPANPDVLLDYAVVLGMSLNHSLIGEPETLIARALRINPNHLQALALQGSVALERGDRPAAVKSWQRLQALAPADSPVGRSLAESIAKAQALDPAP